MHRGLKYDVTTTICTRNLENESSRGKLFVEKQSRQTQAHVLVSSQSFTDELEDLDVFLADA